LQRPTRLPIRELSPYTDPLSTKRPARVVLPRARGLDTCPQAAFTQFHRIIEAQLGLGSDEMVVCGMSLGVADPQAIENTLITEREPVEGFTRFHE
jgi:nitroreductase